MKNTFHKNNRGQILIESILLMFVGVLLFGVLTKAARDGQWMKKIIADPWDKTAGMIEAGVWAPAKQAKLQHPNQLSRINTTRVTE